jgi:hypothetical protein
LFVNSKLKIIFKLEEEESAALLHHLPKHFVKTVDFDSATVLG